MKKKIKKEREHITDGTPCWCNPKIVSYKKSQPQEEWERNLYVESGGGAEWFLTDKAHRKCVSFISNLISKIRKEERERIIKNNKRDIKFLKEMRIYSQKLLDNGYDVVAIEDLHQRIEDWIAELIKNI